MNKKISETRYFRPVPPSPGLLKKIRNAKRLTRMGADIREFDAVDVLDLRSFSILQQRTPKSRAHTLIREKRQVSPMIGTRKALVLLVDFQDKTAATGMEHYKDMLFSNGTYETGSLSDYYREVSWNQLDITGEVSGMDGGWYRAPENLSYYTNDNYGLGDTYPNNAQKLVEDAVHLAEPYVDFSEYDLDGDGRVDALFVVHAGKGAEETGKTSDIWSHQWFTNQPIPVDGVEVFYYSIEPEDGNIGVFCHELGHVFGLPDLYDYGYDSEGVGSWCLMAAGSWNNGGLTPAHLSAWCKKQLGWMIPTNIIRDHVWNIPKVETNRNQSVFRLWTKGLESKEYFLAENRQKTGFDTFLPGEGLLVWHIDENMKDNNDQNHYMVAIEQADGRKELENNLNTGDGGDPFPGISNNRSFNGNSVPDSDSYNGNSTYVKIGNISDPAETMTAYFKVKRSKDTGIESILPGAVVSSTLPTPGSMKSYVIKGVEENKELTIDMKGPKDHDFDVYVKLGSRARIDDWDAHSSTSSPDEILKIYSTRPGDYFITVHSFEGSGRFALKASVEG